MVCKHSAGANRRIRDCESRRYICRGAVPADPAARNDACADQKGSTAPWACHCKASSPTELLHKKVYCVKLRNDRVNNTQSCHFYCVKFCIAYNFRNSPFTQKFGKITYFCVIFVRCAFERQDDIPEVDDLGDGEGGGFIGADDDSQVTDQSIPQASPAPPQQPPPLMPQPRALDDALPPISAHLSKLEKILASRTAD